jgi:ABC-type proline/glycine betaine transport system substrate-binding protein
LSCTINCFQLVHARTDKKKKKAKIKRSEHLYPNWSEGVAFTYLAKVALESDGLCDTYKPGSRIDIW